MAHRQNRLEDFSDIWLEALEGSGTGIWDRNVITGEIRYSASWFSILGYHDVPPSNNIEESYGRVHPDDLDYVKAQMQAHFDQKTPIYEVKHRLRHKDGSYVWVLSRGKVITRDDCGRAVRMVGTTTDITDLKEIEDNYRYMIELHPQIPWVAAPDGRILDIGPQWFAVTGMTREELIENGWIEAVCPQQKSRILDAWKHSLDTGQRFDIEYRLRQADGSYAWYRDRGAARRNLEGKITHWYGMLEDVSDRHVAEEARRYSDKVALRVLEMTDDAVIVFNQDGIITYSNAIAAKLLGDGSTLNGTQIKDLFIESWNQEVKNTIDCIIGTEQNRHLEIFWPYQDMWLDVRLYASTSDISMFIRNNSEQHIAQKKLIYAANHDLLTGAANRTAIFAKISDILARQAPESKIALFCLDVDYFKEINDKYGHPAGDSLLQQIVSRLQSHLRENDAVARCGGDEFLIMQTAIRTPTDAIRLAERLGAEMQEAFEINGVSIKTSVSMGIAISSFGETNVDRLYQQADRALYLAKRKGRGGYRLFSPEMQTLLDKTAHLHTDLASALAREEFFLEFQPIIDLFGKRVVGVEALIRWQHPEKGVVSPAEFIPIAEECGLITELGAWVVRRACEAAHLLPESLRVSVNISPRQFELDNVYRIVRNALLTTGLPAERLKLEITESVLLVKNSLNRKTLQALRDIGVTLVLDDFGTGYSSLSYLDIFKFDYIKIDQSFIARIKNEGDRHQVFEAVIGMTKALNLPATAEGIETEAQLRYAQSLGCEYAQGNYFAKPMQSDELHRFLSSPLRTPI